MAFTPPYLATIRARTLIIHGDRDPLMPVYVPNELYRSIPNAALWIVPNAGHWPFGEDPEALAHFRRTVAAFFAESPAP